MANAGYEFKIDITINQGGGTPVPYTYKGGDWTPWAVWGNDKQTHDATHVHDFGGSGITVAIGVGDGTSSPGTVLDFTSEEAGDDPICNTWIRAGSDGYPAYEGDAWIVLWDDGLTAGTYEVYAYHNAAGVNEPNMLPRVYVATYNLENAVDNTGTLPDGDGNNPNPLYWDGVGVIPEQNDVNVPIMHVGDDALLEPNVSMVRFFTDGSPVIIRYEANYAPTDPNTGIFNAFIIKQISTPILAWGPFPAHGEQYACPDTRLIWKPGDHADTHNVYMGTDLRDELVIFEDDFEAGDANWTPVNWTLYDSNVLADGNNDGNSLSAYYSMTPGSGLGTLTSDPINTSGASSTRVELSLRKPTPEIEAGDIDLYYYDGNDWNFAADLNSVGPNGPWLHYTEDINDPNYFVSTFRLELRSDISGGELFVDNVSVTNTWPTGAEWLKVEDGEPNSYTPPSILDFNTTYYWRIDEVNDACDASPWQGRTWYFTTEKGKARNPDPGDKKGSISPGGIITLEWTSSCRAISGDYIYFSTDFNDVNTSNPSVQDGPVLNQSWDTPVLDFAKKYYWKVTGVGGLPEGDVWTFQTIGYPLMHFTFDGVLDANIHDPCDEDHLTDSTGNVTFSVSHYDSESGLSELRYDLPNPTYNPLGTSAHFITTEPADGDDGAGTILIRSCFGADILDLDGSAYTIEAWVRQDGPAADVEDNDMQGTIIRKDREAYGLGIDNDGTVKYMHNGNVIASPPDRIAEGDWHHIAAVYDSSDANSTEKLYVDGLVAADNNSPAPNPRDDYGSDHVGIGAYREDGVAASHIQNFFNGAIDELRVVDIALEPTEFLIQGDPNLAWLPRPYHRAKNVPYDVDLEWLPGESASSHDVYIGTDWDEVNDANSTIHPNVDYNHVDVNMEDIPYLLDLDQIYYWRVDEVNDTTTETWKGLVWHFTVAEYIIIDDMEDYDRGFTGYPITYFSGSYGWDCGFTNSTGSVLSVAYADPYPLREEQTMIYAYDNGPATKYSEISTKDALNYTDWKTPGVRLLSLWFHGDQTSSEPNENVQMYVGLEDTDSTYAEVRYPLEDKNDVRVEEWQQWPIPLSDFTDVNLASIKTLYIGFGDRTNSSVSGGFGTVYFDDIRVYPPTCIPSERSPAFAALDWDDDCIIGWGELEIMADEWLIGDVNLGQISEPCDANLVGWWKFDEGSGSTASDSSSYNNHGTLEINDVNVSWVAGHDGNGLDFDGGRVRVPDAAELRPMEQVSVSAWIKYSDGQDNGRVVVQGADNKETYQLEVDEDDDLTFHISDGNDYDPCDDSYEGHQAGSDNDALERDEWIHVAGTFDANMIKCYINGELAGENNEPNLSKANFFLCQEPNDLGIGMRPEDDADNFDGIIDEVRIYDYGLSAQEVAWLATDGTGIVSFQSIANLKDDEQPGERVVNFRDLCILGDDWLVQELFPR
jgi:hypothetical protein